MSLLNNIFKIVQITSDRYWDFYKIVLLCLLTGCIEFIGIGALYPFLTLLAKPELVNSSTYISKVFNFMGFTEIRSFLIFFGVLTLIALIASSAAIFYKNAHITKYSISQMNRISTKLMAAYFKLPIEVHLESSSGEVTKNIIAQSDVVTNSALVAVLSLASESFLLMLVTFVFLISSPVETVAMLVWIGATTNWLLSASKEKIIQYGRLCDEINAKRFSFVLSSMQAIKEIKAFNKESIFVGLFSKVAIEMASALTKLMVLQLLPSFFVQLMATGSVVLISIFYLINGENLELIIPSILFLGVIGLRLMPSMAKIANSISILRQNDGIINNVYTVLDTKNQYSEFEKYSTMVFDVPEIEFRNVSFAYRGRSSNAVSNFSFLIPPNKVTAIIGHSGAGKTTLIDLMLGLLQPSSGEIYIQQNKINSFSKEEISRIYAYVHQSFFILDGSIADNVAFGIPPEEINWEWMRKVARISRLHEVINSRSEGWNFQVGERGGRLSGGQRQRLAIARALYVKPKILILDESTNALDESLEADIFDALHELKKEMSVLLVSHNKALINRCDWIVSLEEGGVVASGRNIKCGAIEKSV